MAIEELNAKGVTIGGKKAKFELLAEDDAGDPKQGTAAAQKLVDSQGPGVIGHLNSGTTIPASKIYSDAGIPQISPSATNPKYTRQGYKTTFRVVADDVHLGGTLGKLRRQGPQGQEHCRDRRPHRLWPGRGRRVRKGRQGRRRHRRGP
jgi:branched-chain amino acid transport system substrate-binding protein